MNRHHPDHVPMLILADEHHCARSRVKFLDASRDLGGISRIPQLFQQAAKGSRISGRCRSDSERVHSSKSKLEQSKRYKVAGERIELQPRGELGGRLEGLGARYEVTRTTWRFYLLPRASHPPPSSFRSCS